MNTTYTPEQFAATGKANLKSLEGMANNAYASLEKLVELNLAASKALMSESFSGIKTVLGAKDPQEMIALQAGMFQPVAEKSVAYGRHVYAIATESSAEFTKAFETMVAEAQQGFGSLVDNLSKNAPAGSEAAAAFFKNTVAASRNAIESAKSSAKKAVDAVEANLTAAGDQVIKATATVYKKA